MCERPRCDFFRATADIDGSLSWCGVSMIYEYSPEEPCRLREIHIDHDCTRHHPQPYPAAVLHTASLHRGHRRTSLDISNESASSRRPLPTHVPAVRGLR